MKKEKLNSLNRLKEENNLDLLYISSNMSILYYLDIMIEPIERYLGLFIVNNKIFLLIPLLDFDKVKHLEGIEIVTYKDGENPYLFLKNYLEKENIKLENVGIDTENIALNKYLVFKESVEFKNLVPIDEEIKKMRLYKTSEEIEKMQIAANFADECIRIANNNLKEGITEIELKNIIEKEIFKKGVKKMSFDTMVLFSENASKPHGESSDRRLKKGDTVLIDLGCYYENYASDITRVLKFGEIDEFSKMIYDIVLKANMEAIKQCKIGMKFSELDNISRSIIEESGFGEYFTHRLGHGLGLSCHEYPDVSSYNDMIIEEGMVFTIEPGVYIPNKIGIRIEDDIYMSKEGAISLTKYEK